MTINEGLRLMAGVFILISILLAHYVSPYWLLFTGFIALNLIQSSFTKWCPAMMILKKMGLKEEKPIN
ncbi:MULTISPECIES: YgaP family membrane protein [unclassified Marinobacter]|jgi:hypothetical protein|uniref:YgaP family membrane protein n=1 Tax=unclassified Marinobacter TaxID=83889 RepID=UPI000E83DD97|nr:MULTISPECIES: DUF2892 domain-containing protein [unclassified Marinobacter]MCE0758363.1 DUF2892 domain-containing protein [Marinobacter sp. G11]HBM50397.1 DUF2892 domain-containing protein [Marinobacter sp.]|tara:strand:+ start:23129 stop:23332 length:204 start_codon:yes stop_codon:yes gene_type:complete